MKLNLLEGWKYGVIDHVHTPSTLIGRAEVSSPLSVEFVEFWLYLFIYRFMHIYIYIYFRPYVVHMPLTCNAQTSDRLVEVQKSI